MDTDPLERMKQLLKGASSVKEKELLSNVKRSLVDCLVKVRDGEFQGSLSTLLMGIDALAKLECWVSGNATTEREARKDNHKRFVAFLRNEIPEWTEHEMQWEGEPIPLDLSEISYHIRCKQIHEYSDLSSKGLPAQLNWNHPDYSASLMWVYGRPTSKVVDRVELNGFKLLQGLVEVVQKYVGIFSSTVTNVGSSRNPYAVYELLGTVRTGQAMNRYGLHSHDPDAVR